MAVAYKMRFEGATLEQYDQIVALMGMEDGVAHVDGAIFHWVTEIPDGLLVVDVWETDEQFNRFAEEKIGPYSQQVGIPNPPVTTRHEIHNSIVGAKIPAHV